MAALRVNPTRMELTRVKTRLVTAKRGHKLLKDKRDELVRQFIALIRENAKLRQKTEKDLQTALRRFAMARAVMDGPALESALMYPARSAHVNVGIKNILSVRVPE
ncbi:MAG: V-type ATP synthase subunit D, partial [Eubacteriales bacterium]|nr:V-type ATP synthase subunit D [Eubacteriales bacterium]